MTKKRVKSFIDALLKLRTFITDEQAISVSAIYPEWNKNIDYAINDRVLYNNILYKVIIAHTSQENWTPDVSPSLFTEVLIPDLETIYEWKQPDSTNPYMIGDKVIYENETWVSIVDNNVWAPNSYGWEKV